ncbi:SgcJ/EcaC family oxidoreductase [Hymenobacter sp. BT770]|uniref:YybH family protein n=1 Tax=Hymenobacter sp. BT770 TaxID=2886942 RepID=UPI001D1198F6|nr:SgcJ/EcaC family oxidoreductase [Hymenobacter sp. BT770]MCC3151640.1 SgcJ/EcaC family oxidoreductase [Hymenobacter sp. BT770]MDO3413783.1 SgcJ/EcaC family oxidoreductase [Hymenobacter sp. BT770]
MPTLATSISDEIRRANATFEANFERGDAAAVASLYTPNGVLLPTGMEPIEGPAGIQAFWQGAMEMGIKRVKLHTREVEQLTDTAIELGNYTLYGPQDTQLDQGKYVVVWKEQEGQWKLHQDIWNTSQPAPAQ